MSPSAYNAKTSLLICCLTTTHIKGYSFEVLIAGQRPGGALADQVKNLDWGARKPRQKGKVSANDLAQVKAKIIASVWK